MGKSAFHVWVLGTSSSILAQDAALVLGGIGPTERRVLALEIGILVKFAKMLVPP